MIHSHDERTRQTGVLRYLYTTYIEDGEACYRAAIGRRMRPAVKRHVSGMAGKRHGRIAQCRLFTRR